MSHKRYFSSIDLKRSFEETDKINFFIGLKSEEVLKIPVSDTTVDTSLSTEGEIIRFSPQTGTSYTVAVEDVAFIATSDDDELEGSGGSGAITLSPSPLLIRNTDILLDTKYSMWDLYTTMGQQLNDLTDINRVCGRCILNIGSGDIEKQHILKFNMPVDDAVPLTFPHFEHDGSDILLARKFNQSMERTDTTFKYTDFAVNKTQVRSIKWDYMFFKSTWSASSQRICTINDYKIINSDKCANQELVLVLRLKDGNILNYNFMIVDSDPYIIITPLLKIGFVGLASFVNPGIPPQRGNEGFFIDITEIEDYTIEFNSMP